MNTSTRTSIRRRAGSARRRERAIRSSRSRAQPATSTPAAPPAAESSKLSVSNCRIKRQASGAQRQANADFLAARGGPRQQQVGDVGAGDQQHEPHDPHQQHQGLGVALAHAREPSRGWDQRRRASLRPSAASARSDSSSPVREYAVEDNSASARACSTVMPGFSAANDVHPIDLRLVVKAFPAGHLCLHHQRRPQVGAPCRRQTEKLRRGDADDRI